MRDLNEIRKEINSIDEQLVKLFVQRMDCSKAVAEYKKANNIPILNVDREQEVLDRAAAESGDYASYTRRLYEKIMKLSRDLQNQMIDGETRG